VSPRRKIDAEQEFEAQEFFAAEVQAPRRRGLAVVAGLSAVVLAAVVGGLSYLAVVHQREVRVETRSASVLGYVEEFMKGFTSIDPYHANAYGDRILSAATGDFAKQYKEKLDAMLLQVARAQPSAGTVEAAGVQRWNEDGSADILIAMKLTTTTADGKSTVESGSRWVVTASQEGQQWKISRLNQVA